MKSFILFYKPFGVLSQFSPIPGKQTLKDFGPFPSRVYPVGRLDADSEGLLLLTDDNNVKHRLTDPKFKHARTYVVQVERTPDEQALRKLQEGISIGGRKTRPAEAVLLTDEPHIFPRPIPVRFRKTVPTAWIKLTLYEGRNRQVRKMTAAVGHPTLRLVRIGIGILTIYGLRPGEWRRLTEAEVKRLVKRTMRKSNQF